MMVNLGSKPKMHCSTITEVVMIIAFLYFLIKTFMTIDFNNIPNPEYSFVVELVVF